MIGQFVIVRTHSAGVHVGTLAEFHGTCVRLTDARRVHRWRGANTLHELSVSGCDDSFSRISEPVADITITQAIEVIPCTTTAKKNLTRSRWAG
jgi:hypothetical protein